MTFGERLRSLLRAAAPAGLSREGIARHVLRGEGIEIGALHSPFPVPSGVRVRYVDRMPETELRRQYPEMDYARFVPVDIVDDGERLGRIADSSLDFVIASHFLEHCQDPIGAIENFLRVLRPGGVAYIIVPWRGNQFDRDRPVTTLEHLLRDHREGAQGSRRRHYEDWVRIGLKVVDDEAWALNRIEHYLKLDYSIHFHVWDAPALLKMMVALRDELGFAFEVEVFVGLAEEYATVLRKAA